MYGEGWGLSRIGRRPLFSARPSRYSCRRPTGGTGMNPFLWLIFTLIDLYIWILIASAVLSWLVAFNVVNTRNQVVSTIGEFLYRITEPVLRPIRNMLPNLGGIDISPVILILIILLIENIIVRYIYPNVF
jgi:YggT family protein